MRKIQIKWNFLGKEATRTAVLTDDLQHPIPDKENQADGCVDGVADELGIWSIYFDNNTIEADFVCEIDEDDYEVKTLTPVELWLYDENGDTLNDETIEFQVKEL